MKTSKNNTLTKNILSGMVAVSMILCINSCAKKHAAARSETSMAAPVVVSEAAVVVPAENKGMVQIKRDINSNYVILINLKELEEAAKIEPASKKAYIVWMNADKQMVKNLGQINSNSGWLSDKSKASFEGISEFKPTKIYITEEDDATAKIPGKKIIWSTNPF
jgi:cytochrome oxidase assembly protein ShyY1